MGVRCKNRSVDQLSPGDMFVFIGGSANAYYDPDFRDLLRVKGIHSDGVYVTLTTSHDVEWRLNPKRRVYVA